MAEVKYLHLHEEEFHDEEDLSTLDSIPFWSHNLSTFSPDLSPSTAAILPDPISAVDLSHRGSFLTDSDSDLNLGLGFCMDDDDDDGGELDDVDVFGFGDEYNSGFMPAEEEVRVIGIESDSDNDRGSSSVQICWDSFHLEEEEGEQGGDVSRGGGAGEDFEWEEVDGGAVVDEREALRTFFDADLDDDSDMSVALEDETPSRDLEWEFLLNVSNSENGEAFFGGDQEDDYEMLVGQFTGNEAPHIRKPPASKSVVMNLPVVVVDEEEASCAICKDDIGIGEQAKELPCSHRYHCGCIEPWLGMRNTCPVCRYELPTDDVEYERRRNSRVA